MRIIIGILIFYRKLVLPSLAVAIALGYLGVISTGEFSMKTFGISYFLMSICFHYIIYEKRNPGEYYFYYNMGLSKRILWGTTLFVSLVFGLILMILWAICR